MAFHTSTRKLFSGQNDVQPILHVPMVYENIPARALSWEYHVLRVDTSEEELPTEGDLNALGALGWMLVSVLEQRLSERGSHVHYHFVRPTEI